MRHILAAILATVLMAGCTNESDVELARLKFPAKIGNEHTNLIIRIAKCKMILIPIGPDTVAVKWAC